MRDIRTWYDETATEIVDLSLLRSSRESLEMVEREGASRSSGLFSATLTLMEQEDLSSPFNMLFFSSFSIDSNRRTLTSWTQTMSTPTDVATRSWMTPPLVELFQGLSPGWGWELDRLNLYFKGIHHLQRKKQRRNDFSIWNLSVTLSQCLYLKNYKEKENQQVSSAVIVVDKTLLESIDRMLILVHCFLLIVLEVFAKH